MGTQHIFKYYFVSLGLQFVWSFIVGLFIYIITKNTQDYYLSLGLALYALVVVSIVNLLYFLPHTWRKIKFFLPCVFYIFLAISQFQKDEETFLVFLSLGLMQLVLASLFMKQAKASKKGLK